MINRRELLDAAQTLGLLPQVVEKDYVLGWVLASIYQQVALVESWIFKGGTRLPETRHHRDRDRHAGGRLRRYGAAAHPPGLLRRCRYSSMPSPARPVVS